MKEPSAAVLLSELHAQPKTKANHVIQLLGLLESAQQEATQRAIIQGLKLFFVDAGLDGQLLPPAQESDSKAPAVVYRAWLRRQYARYTSLLITLATAARCTASIQVAAFSAIMELVRAECGTGAISGHLYMRALTSVCTAPDVQPEVFSLLFSRYLQYADVRYYTLAAVKAMAAGRLKAAAESLGIGSDKTHAAAAAATDVLQPARKKGKGNKDAQPTAAPAAQPFQQQADAATDKEGDSDVDTSRLPLGDLCRNMFDVLTALPVSLAECSGKGTQAEANVRDGAGPLRSWCGAAEEGVVAAKADKNESSKARRKRKADEGGNGSNEPNHHHHQQQQQQQALWANAKTHKRMYSEAWLALLSLSIPSELLRKVLLVVHDTLIPNMMHPALLADFLTHCLDQGGLTGMLALNGIFQLVTQHGLEYTAFYKRLYGLMTASAMASKHRAQFFALADTFLSSPLVPAYTVAAFSKRLARLALRSSPAGAMLAVAFIHNMIRRHPSCMVLLHNPSPSAPVVQAQTKNKANGIANIDNDPYLETEPDPAKSHAVESSLWEIEALRHHYCPHVSALTGVLDRDLSDRRKTSEVDVGPLLGTSYSSLFNQEVTRRIKQVPIAFYAQPPTSLFGAHNAKGFEGWKLPAQEQEQE